MTGNQATRTTWQLLWERCQRCTRPRPDATRKFWPRRHVGLPRDAATSYTYEDGALCDCVVIMRAKQQRKASERLTVCYHSRRRWHCRGCTCSCCLRDAGPVNTVLVRVVLRERIRVGQVIGAVVQPAGIIVKIEVDRYACWHAGTVRLAWWRRRVRVVALSVYGILIRMRCPSHWTHCRNKTILRVNLEQAFADTRFHKSDGFRNILKLSKSLSSIRLLVEPSC